jgi:hypothetical protein
VVDCFEIEDEEAQAYPAFRVDPAIHVTLSQLPGPMSVGRLRLYESCKHLHASHKPIDRSVTSKW